MFKKTIIGIIGPNADSCTSELYEFGLELGKYLTDNGYLIVCGGKFGLMEAVCKGSRDSEHYRFGTTIGIIPESEKTFANPYVDIIIPSGLGVARNSLIINTSDLIIALGGGAGTLTELAFAWQKNKLVFCNTHYEGWAKELALKEIDHRNNKIFKSFRSISDLGTLLENIFI